MSKPENQLYCPLSSAVWEEKFPEICRVNCEALWEDATLVQKPTLDLFDKLQTHEHGELEHGGEMLQPGEGHERLYSLLSVCTLDGLDVVSETYSYQCPFETER